MCKRIQVQYVRFGAREAGQDEGGLYHDCLSTLCDELNEGASGLLPFLQPTPNEANALGGSGGGGGAGRGELSSNASSGSSVDDAGGEEARQRTSVAMIDPQEMYQVGRRGELLPAPYAFASTEFGPSAYTEAEWREGLQLVGRLLGVGIRSTTPLALRLSPIFWKVLLHGGGSVSENEVAKIDIVTWHAVKTMSKLTEARDFERVGYTFSILPMFSRVRSHAATSSSASEHSTRQLIPNGHHINVTRDNLTQCEIVFFIFIL